MLCKSREHTPRHPGWPEEDEWRDMPDGTKTCSFCGSMREEDLLAICDEVIAGKPGFEVEWSDKNYKIYAKRPGTTNAGDGAIKFYIWHVDREHADLRQRAELVNLAHNTTIKR